MREVCFLNTWRAGGATSHCVPFTGRLYFLCFRCYWCIDFRERREVGEGETERQRDRETSMCCFTYLCIHWLSGGGTCNFGTSGRRSKQLSNQTGALLFSNKLLKWKKAYFLVCHNTLRSYLESHHHFHHSAWLLSQRHFQIGTITYTSLWISAHLVEFVGWGSSCRMPVIGRLLLTFVQKAGMRTSYHIGDFGKVLLGHTSFCAIRN